MPRIEIADFDLTDALMSHIDGRSITEDDLLSVLERFWIVTRNRGQRTATHLV